MKILTSPFLFMLILALSTSFKANSQKLFDAIPEKLQFENKVIEGVFNLNPSTSVNIKFSPNFSIKGIIKSNQKVYENLQTVVIELTNYNNAKLFISKTIDDDKSIKYVGRIIGRTAQDGFEIKTDLTGNGTLKKINLKEMIVE